MLLSCVLTLASLLPGEVDNSPRDVLAFLAGDAHLARIAERSFSIWDVYCLAAHGASPRTAILLLLGKPNSFSCFVNLRESWTYSRYGVQIDFDGCGKVVSFRSIPAPGVPSLIRRDMKALQGVWIGWDWGIAVFKGDRVILIRGTGISVCTISLELRYRLDPTRNAIHLVLPETQDLKNWEDIPSDLSYSLQGDTLQMSYTKDGKLETISLARWRPSHQN